MLGECSLQSNAFYAELMDKVVEALHMRVGRGGVEGLLDRGGRGGHT
jgi:hypothetical protein